jgi:hypothetical protein
MFTSRYPLERRGRKRVEVSRSRDWSEVVVRVDGVELGRIHRDELREGVDFALHDYSILRVWLEVGPRGMLFLYLSRNGHPLPGSEGDPVKILHGTVVTMAIVAGVQIAFAAVVIGNDRADETIYRILAAGSILALLCLGAWHRSLPATVGASLVCVGELAYFFFTEGHLTLWNVWDLFFALSLVVWLLLRGIRAARQLKAITLPIRHPPEPLHRKTVERG